MNTEFQKIIDYRRSNRKFNPDVNVPDEIIRISLERAILSPNSSNMQLWEFYWIKSEEALMAMVPLCLGQQAAATAKQMVVFVTRKDKWRERSNWNFDLIKETIQGEPTKIQKKALRYYDTIMPLLYRSDFWGISTLIRKCISLYMGWRKPFYRAGGKNEQRITVHKSCALAAQTFMLSVAAEGFHSCPMEGFDEKRIKKFLGLPKGAEINMVISVGLGTEAGIWGKRYRVPYEEVVFVR
jgi:nitroreductase